MLISAILPAAAFAADGAQIVSSDLPAALDCGATTTARVTVRNTGTTTWTAEVYKLGPVGDNDDLGGPARIYLPNGATVAPGGVHTFTFRLTAPGSERIAKTDWRMVHEGVAWFGGIASRNVSVTCSSSVDNAQIVSSTLPTELGCGQTFEASVTVRNTGGTTWTADTYKLGARGDSDDLSGPGRIYLPPGTRVTPGGQHTFRFTLTAPSEPTSALTDWRMVHEGLAWFGDTARTTVEVDCTDPVDNAIVVDSTLPDFLHCGERADAKVTMRNTGNTPWTSDVYKLGAVGDNDLLGGPLRVPLPSGTTIPPGGEHTFPFALTGPYELNGAPSKWRMVHEGVAWFGSYATTWVDLECGCAVGGCAAGCAHVPTFTVSTARVGTHDPVTFTVANPQTILDEMPNWDFGDGNHCDHCPRTVTHRYATPGVYRARLTATESQCGTTVVSKAVEIEAFDHAVARQNAEIVELDLPNALCGAAYSATVTVKNTGHGVWVPGEFFLGAVGNSDPFSDNPRIPLTREVAPQEVYTFEFPLRPPGEGCPFSPCRTEWQMVWEHHSWFGGKAWEDIEVRACTTGGTGDYVCRASVFDEYQRPLPGKAVVLETFIYGDTKWEVVDRAFSVSDAEGMATVTMDVSEPAVRLRCLVDLHSAGRNTTGYVIDHDGIPSGTEVEVAAVAIPEPTSSYGAIGHRGASANAHLYQSGDYDRVVVIPEPFAPDELVKGPRGREGLWDELDRFLLPLFEKEFDVWVINPPATGQNIHEQAAEFAQVVEYATREYPNRNGSGPTFNNQAASIGISLGGVVSRVATARWESPAPEDANWRRSLGLSDPLPVGFMLFIDSPLRGANVSSSLQSFLWAPFGISAFAQPGNINMNSCAFHQMVILQSYQPTGCPPPLASKSCNWESFYTKGREVKFPGSGTCDSKSNGICRCEAGPAVFSINGDGFAHAPRIVGYSDAKQDERNRCYGDHRDLTREGNKNMCAAKPWARILWRDEEWLKIDINNLPDAHFRLTDADLVPGSRVGSSHGDKSSGAVQTEAVQYSAPTFIPFTSSRGSGDNSCAFDACYENTFNGPHVNPSDENAEKLIGELLGWVHTSADTSVKGLSTNGPFVAEPGQPIEFSTASSTENGMVSWDLGDGTVRSGSSVSHAYQIRGIFPVKVTMETPDGGRISATSRARIGIPANAAPVITPMANVVAQPDEPVVITASPTDSDGTIVKTFWNFGDAEVGDGARITHTWSEPGTYSVVFTATDDEGASATARLFVSVGTPSAPEVNAPIMEGVGTYPIFVWTSIDEASAYTIRVISESDSSMRQVTVDASDACSSTICRATLETALGEGDHFWSVTASNQFGDGPSSDWSQFRVQTSRNNPPTATIDISGTCAATCTVNFNAFASDSDGEALGYAWSGCGQGAGESLACNADSPGVVNATVAITDERGATATAEASAVIFADSYAVGQWGACSASCGGGTQNRSVVPSLLTLTAPGVDQPPTTRQCNTQKCALTCYDYTNMYPKKNLCTAAGWRVCERRYRGNGIGGTLTCWKGFK